MGSVQDSAPPSAAAIAIGTAIVSVVVGYYIGQAQSIGVFGGSSRLHPAALADDDESDASDADSQSGGVHEVGELKQFAGSSDECKLVLVTRTDLGMGKGKPSQHPFRFCYTPPVAISRAYPVQELGLAASDDPVTPLALATCSRDEAVARALSLTRRRHTDTVSRQDSRTMFSRYAGLLQDDPACRSSASVATTLGATRPGEGRAQSGQRG
jgi:hypothetical protein